MKATISAVIAALESAAIALSVFAVIGVTGFLLWWFTFELSAEPAAVLSGIAAVWMLSHFVPITFTVPPELVLAFGIPPEAASFVLSFVPLGLTAITVFLALRLGVRSGHRGGSGLASVCGAVIGFALATFIISIFAKPFILGSAWEAVLLPVVAFTVSVGIGFLWAAITDPHQWWEDLSLWFLKLVQRVFPGLAAALPNLLREVCRVVGALLAVLVFVGGISVFVAIVAGYVEIISLSQTLQLTVFGIVVLFLVHLAVLPVALTWAIAWLSGVGFSVGEGSEYSPFFTTQVPLPAVPLVGALPESWGWASVIAPAIIICLSIIVGAAHAGSVRVRRQTALIAFLVPLMASICVGVIAGLTAMMAGGSFGPGLFEVSGVESWLFAGVLAAECAVGLWLGTWGRRIEMSIRAQRQVSGNTSGFLSDAPENHVDLSPKVHLRLSDTQESAPQMSLFGSTDHGTIPRESEISEQTTEALIRQYAWNPESAKESKQDFSAPLRVHSSESVGGADQALDLTNDAGADFTTGKAAESAQITPWAAVSSKITSRLTNKWRKGNQTD